VTSATIVIFGEAIWDPVVLVSRIGNAPVIILGALIVLVAQLTTNMAANVVSPANDFSSLAPRRVTYVTGGLITALIIGILMMPWRLYADASAYIFTWLVGYSSLMGAIGGILIADYWIVRRRMLSVRDLFAMDGAYAYRGGVNYLAIAVLVASILPVAPGFVRAAATPGGQVSNPTLLDSLYTYAWFVTFGLSFVLYILVSVRRRRS
jgi:NCS1 family nucleobase:cation symporter-1